MGLVRSKTPNLERDCWRTPQAVFDMLDARYGPFTLDAAAHSGNHLCGFWLGPGSEIASDALAPSTRWHRFYHERDITRVFCNPPYTLTREFLVRGRYEVLTGNCLSATFLVPATTDVAWFHNLVYNADLNCWHPGVTCEFSQGRIRFERPDGSKAGTPTHGSLFVTFRGVK